MPIPSANTTSPSPARQEPNEPKPSLTCPHCGACTETSICEYCTAPKRCRTRSTSATANDESKKDVRRHCKSDQCNPRPQRSLLLNSRREDDAWVDLSSERLPNSRLGALYPGSRFTGVQRSGTTSYEVAVDIQHVDLKEYTLSGHLYIKGLTAEFPELTTFFQGEIIGPKYSFLTRKWQAQQWIDACHWKRFPSFKPYIEIFNDDGFVYDPYDKDFIYMRWKEQFLVPDHRVNNIDGASFAGFYYICYQRSTNVIKGFYFYRHHTEWYQELTLKHEEERCFGNFELR